MKPFYDRNGIIIYCGECSKVLEQFPGLHFNLTVTSPPYDALRTYKGYIFDFGAISSQLWRVTDKGGVVVWVVADQTVDGSETGTSFRQALGFMELGFKLHDTMIYKRKTKPLTHNRYEQEFEYMFVLARPGKSIVCNHITQATQKPGKEYSRLTQRHRQSNGITTTLNGNWITPNQRIKGNVWEYYVGNNQNKDKLSHVHPAIFPEALARDHILSWSNSGDLVLDPMAGSGTVGKMAFELGRRCVLIDISEEYCKIMIERLRQPSFWSLPSRPDSDERQTSMWELLE